MVVELPLQIEVLVPALAEGNGFTVITTEFDLLQDVAVIVSTKVYVVVTVGLTFGFDKVEVNPLGLLVHEYVLPLTAVAPILAEPPTQMAELLPALAAGRGLTVTTTVFDLLHEVAVTVSVKVKVVVTVGLTLGLLDVLINPLGFEVHE